MKDAVSYTMLDERARSIFRHIVESYVASGEPMGSRTISRTFDLSSATIRNVMADLEDLGLLEAPHVSAGRKPTTRGLRYFIDGILETGSLTEAERKVLQNDYHEGDSLPDILEEAGRILCGLSSSAGLVVAPKTDKPIRHIEFVGMREGCALVVIVAEDGSVENRITAVPDGMTPDLLRQVSVFLSERVYGRTIAQTRSAIREEIRQRRGELGERVSRAIEAGLAIEIGGGNLIVRGTANLLATDSLQEIERIKILMEQLEAKETASRLLEEAAQAEGVKIFLGSENPVFQTCGHALILSPYQNREGGFIGAIGVIGPMRLDYAKIIPSVNFLAEIISRNIRKLSEG